VRTAWIMPGQGSFRPGCLREAITGEGPAAIAARDTVEQLVAASGRDLLELGDDAGTGARTADAQPTITATSLAVAAALRAEGLEPDLVAGHSLGECTAAIVAGALSLADGAQVVAARGAAMGQACVEEPGAMGAVVKLAPEAVDAVLADHPTVVVANDNAPGQVVVAGPPDDVAALKDDVRAAGGRLVPLDVEGAFHSRAMRSAVPVLEQALAAATVSDPTVPLLSGVRVAALTAGEDIAAALRDGILSPVRWREVQDALAADGVTHLVEVGPGGVLAGLAKRAVPDLEVRTVATPSEATELAVELHAAAL
jgi:[acyl-carrier-protein] S-malonyltransferase